MSQRYVRVNKDGRQIYAHIVVAEKALGKVLPKGAVVHHINNDSKDNRPSNLVICQDQTYHHLLHVRADAYKATGDANKRRCTHCQVYDDVANLRFKADKISPNGVGMPYHLACAASYARRTKALRVAKKKIQST